LAGQFEKGLEGRAAMNDSPGDCQNRP